MTTSTTPSPRRKLSRRRKLGTNLHRLVYRLTGGILGAHLGLGRFLLLTTTGRKSGQRHTIPIAYFEDLGERYIVASNWGNERHAAWYLNILADPQVEVQLGFRHYAATAVETPPELRARLWPLIVAHMSVFARYQAGITREIPVVLLRTPVQ